MTKRQTDVRAPETGKQPAKPDTLIEEEPLTLREKIRRWYRRLPDKKQYLEFVTALLTIPVLLTVIISNVQTLQRQKQNDVSVTPIPSPTVQETKPVSINTTTPSPTVTISTTPSMTPSAACIKEVGPVSIVYPEEGSTVTKDPVCIDISRTGVDYCAVVWSYRINGGNWSDYTDKSICLYGLSGGSKTLELRVKSIVTGAETILTRTFTVSVTATPTSTTSTSSGTLTN